jgi:LPXTG-motif cell wall-anchored protein
VAVTSPSGVTPTCDIPADGIVPAGAVVHCSATYVPTDGDAAAGSVTFEVLLSGWIPLGPGNPRAAAATQTMIVVSQSITMDVAAGPVLASDVSDALADTGVENNHLPLALVLMFTGVALLVARRKFLV